MPTPTFTLDNSYARELPGCYVAWPPAPVTAPRLLYFNRELAHELGLGALEQPRGLAGQDIPLFGRIVAVADVFDALTSQRPYKEAWPAERALSYIESEAGGHFGLKA